MRTPVLEAQEAFSERRVGTPNSPAVFLFRADADLGMMDGDKRMSVRRFHSPF